MQVRARSTFFSTLWIACEGSGIARPWRKFPWRGGRWQLTSTAFSPIVGCGLGDGGGFLCLVAIALSAYRVRISLKNGSWRSGRKESLTLWLLYTHNVRALGPRLNLVTLVLGKISPKC